MRKIKSVKLAKEFNNGVSIAEAGSKVIKDFNNTGYWYVVLTSSTFQSKWYFPKECVAENRTGLFAIEYEPEGFELKRYTEYGFLDYDSFMERELNRLADWCDGQSEKDEDKLYFEIVNTEESKLDIAIYIFTYHQGLKFHSEKSADLFLSELNKPENSNYKNYFIELLKKTRL
jgi:hypothetical protein